MKPTYTIGEPKLPENHRKTVLNQLMQAIHRLVTIPGTSELIPEVGSNFVYCLPQAKELTDVAGLTGRIILVKGQPRAVGDVDFGWAPYMGRVILEAHHINPKVRSAISLRYHPHIVKTFRGSGFDVAKFQLSENQPIPDCMTLAGLKTLGFVPDVLFDQGAHGLEPLIVVFRASPDEIVNIIEGILPQLSSSR